MLEAFFTFLFTLYLNDTFGTNAWEYLL